MKTFTVFAIIVVCVFVISCATFSGASSLNIAFSVYSEHASVKLITHELKAQVAKGTIKSVALHNANKNTQKQGSDIQSIVNSGSADVLVIQSTDADFIQRVSDIVHTSDGTMSIIFLVLDESVFEAVLANTRAHDRVGCIVMFGEDAGLVQARFVKETLRGRGNVGLLLGTLGSPAQIHMTRGFEQGLKGSNVVIRHQESAHGKSIAASKLVEAWLENTPYGLNAIVANDDAMARGAALSLQERGIRDHVLVVGGGRSEDGFVALQAGELDMTLVPNAPAVVRELLRMTRHMLQNEWVQRDIAVPPRAVTPRTIDSFFND